jgi:hypothetical protein
MWVKHCHKPPIWECFIPSIYVDLGDGLLLFYPHYFGELLFEENTQILWANAKSFIQKRKQHMYYRFLQADIFSADSE